MSCKKIWWNLPKSINLNFKWFNLPAQLDNYLNNLMIEKPNCYNSIYPNGHSKFLWWNLPKQVEKLCILEQCELEQETTEYTFFVNENNCILSTEKVLYLSSSKYYEDSNLTLLFSGTLYYENINGDRHYYVFVDGEITNIGGVTCEKT